MEEEIGKLLLKQSEMRPYLEKQMMPDLRAAIKELLNQIRDNRELDYHWTTKEKENAKLLKQTRRAERDRRRLEQGSNYQSDEEEKFEDESESEKDEFDDSYYDEEDGEGEDGESDEDGAGSTF